MIAKQKFLRKCIRNVWNRNTLFLENVRMDVCVCACVRVCVCMSIYADIS